MSGHKSSSYRLFQALNYGFLTALAILCVMPLVHLFAVSFSSNSAATAGEVFLWPVEFTTKSYEFVLTESAFMKAMGVTVLRVLLGVSINMVLTILVAYPLSKDAKALSGRTVYVWIFVFTMLFSGGIIPMYMTMRFLGLLDTIWVLVLHAAVPVFNIVILLNFFRNLPKELEEAALIDGAGHWRIMWGIFVPLSAASIATVTLFSIVMHWNAWFDGILYMNSPDHYPLQSYLYTVVVGIQSIINSSTDMDVLTMVSDRTARAAQLFVGSIPVLLVYPFLQRHFTKGIVLGSVKE
ncbi:carbohydrate ABC transporter permease [Paenibacillus soyae]|uniref:Carbohydrate ABC transporter permease n=1 Tax=Paenibacillus soyae TaxID=2969249 RepID=A0A9X2MR57_9BACL|nr:carbohydrate ABC transporter permease [Paenibacillus soyae]MCR2804865.1 carbohydrate ABC transporter permease [Paenibacillus soyae]